MAIIKSKIANCLTSAAVNHTVATAADIYDENYYGSGSGEYQDVINQKAGVDTPTGVGIGSVKPTSGTLTGKNVIFNEGVVTVLESTNDDTGHTNEIRLTAKSVGLDSTISDVKTYLRLHGDHLFFRFHESGASQSSFYNVSTYPTMEDQLVYFWQRVWGSVPVTVTWSAAATGTTVPVHSNSDAVGTSVTTEELTAANQKHWIGPISIAKANHPDGAWNVNDYIIDSYTIPPIGHGTGNAWVYHKYGSASTYICTQLVPNGGTSAFEFTNTSTTDDAMVWIYLSGAVAGSTTVSGQHSTAGALATRVAANEINKQDKLIAGNGISISGNVISASGATFTAGAGVKLIGSVLQNIGEIDIEAAPSTMKADATAAASSSNYTIKETKGSDTTASATVDEYTLLQAGSIAYTASSDYSGIFTTSNVADVIEEMIVGTANPEIYFTCSPQIVEAGTATSIVSSGSFDLSSLAMKKNATVAIMEGSSAGVSQTYSSVGPYSLTKSHTLALGATLQLSARLTYLTSHTKTSANTIEVKAYNCIRWGVSTTTPATYTTLTSTMINNKLSARDTAVGAMISSTGSIASNSSYVYIAVPSGTSTGVTQPTSATLNGMPANLELLGEISNFYGSENYKIYRFGDVYNTGTVLANIVLH